MSTPCNCCVPTVVPLCSGFMVLDSATARCVPAPGVVASGTGASAAPCNAVNAPSPRATQGASSLIRQFDSVFFGSEHTLKSAGAPSALSFAFAAALAVTIDFPLDAAVKR